MANVRKRTLSAVIVLGGTLAALVAVPHVANAAELDNAYTAQSATVEVGHVMFHSITPVTIRCDDGFHVDGVWVSDGQFYPAPAVHAHGNYISIDHVEASGKYGPASRPLYQTDTVYLHNSSLISDHSGYAEVDCVADDIGLRESA